MTVTGVHSAYQGQVQSEERGTKFSWSNMPVAQWDLAITSFDRPGKRYVLAMVDSLVGHIRRGLYYVGSFDVPAVPMEGLFGRSLSDW
jgi:hypothetical protein